MYLLLLTDKSQQWLRKSMAIVRKTHKAAADNRHQKLCIHTYFWTYIAATEEMAGHTQQPAWEHDFRWVPVTI